MWNTTTKSDHVDCRKCGAYQHAAQAGGSQCSEVAHKGQGRISRVGEIKGLLSMRFVAFRGQIPRMCEDLSRNII